jgi:hypothetical protein
MEKILKFIALVLHLGKEKYRRTHSCKKDYEPLLNLTGEERREKVLMWTQKRELYFTISKYRVFSVYSMNKKG